MNDKNTGSDAVDLDKLEELAKAATHGPWIFTKYGNVMDSGKIFEIVPSDTMREDRLYIAAANPATVLALIAQARAAAPAATAEPKALGRYWLAPIAAQRSRMRERFANRPRTPATADFDLPAPNDNIDSVASGHTQPVATDFDEATLMKLVREFAEVCYGQRHTTEDVGGKLVAYVKSLAAPAPQQVPLTDAAEGFALVPLRMTTAMQQVVTDEEWQWEDLLAAAESITEDQYNSIAAGSAASAGDATQAARDVLAERRRQVEAEGWTPEHDDMHGDGQMAVAAGYYALACGYPHERDIGRGHVPTYWPWAPNWWKPSTKRRNLIKAGALIIAEIERIDRAAMAATQEKKQ